MGKKKPTRVRLRPDPKTGEVEIKWLKSRAEIEFDIDAPCKAKSLKLVDVETRRIGGYATVWGELDCDGDRMSRRAIEPYVGKGRPLMLWWHGIHPEVKHQPIGDWDEESFKMDEKGLYVEGNIDRSEAGDYAWNQIVDAGGFGLSVRTGLLTAKRRRLPDGSREIIDWPLFEITVAEGGKQCVPSSREDIKGEVLQLYQQVAAKMNISLPDAAGDGVPNRSKEATMSDKKGADTGTPEVAAQLAELQAWREEQEKREAARIAEEAKLKLEADIDAAAKVKADELADAKKEEWEAALLAEWKVEQAAREAKLEEEFKQRSRPRVPATGVPGQKIEATHPTIQILASPYDRLSTFDLSLRYQVLKSQGVQPSERFWRALAVRAWKMGREWDTMGIENGQPVRVPAIDRDVILPRDLDFDDEGKPFKIGNVEVPGQGKDVLSKTGLLQFAEIVGLDEETLYSKDAMKANELIYSTQASYGDEWVPTLMAADLWRTIRLQGRILPLLDQFDMISNPQDWPIESTDPTWYKVAETTAEASLAINASPYTDSKVGTGKKTFSALKIGALTFWTEEQDEDGIIVMEPQLRDQYGMSLAETIDEVLLSGDETTGTVNISYEGSAIDAASRFLLMNGIRHEALVTTTTDSTDGGAISVDDFGEAQGYMGTGGKFGVDPSALAFLMDSGVWHKSKLLSEVLTVDKFGPMATILNGQLGALFGVPFVVPEKYSLTDATGRIDETAADNVKGSFCCINRKLIKVGWKRRPRIRIIPLPLADAIAIQGSARFDVQFREAGAVGMKYNLTI